MQCPACHGFGITKDGQPCQLCNRAGFMDEAHQEGFDDPDFGFSVTKDAEEKGRYDFEIRGSGIGAGAWGGFIFAGGLIGAPLTFLLTIEARSGAVILFTWLGFVGVALLFALWLHIMRSASHEFVVTQDAIHVEGFKIRKTDVAEIFIRSSDGNRATGIPVSSGTVVAGFGAPGALAVGAFALSNMGQTMGAAAGHAIKESLETRGYSVCIRHGRNVIPLAENLDEETALSLINEVAKVF